MTEQMQGIRQQLADMPYIPVSQDTELPLETANKIPWTQIMAMGAGFSALAQNFTQAGQSGMYWVDTHGSEMFRKHASGNYIGSLKNAAGTVGGGQADIMKIPADPATLFMAAALANIDRKLDAIQQTQQEILAFLEQKEHARLKGNLNVLTDILNQYKYNWENDTYKTNKHIQIQEIKREAEQSILLYREQIAARTAKRQTLHGDHEVRSLLQMLQSRFEEYQLSLYLYAFSAFLEIMLLENFTSAYLASVADRIREYAVAYRDMYEACYRLMEAYASSSLQTKMLDGLSGASKLMGKALAKVPKLNQTQIDESLIAAGDKLQHKTQERTQKHLTQLISAGENVVQTFIDNISIVDDLYNRPGTFLFDKENLYILPIAA